MEEQHDGGPHKVELQGKCLDKVGTVQHLNDVKVVLHFQLMLGYLGWFKNDRMLAFFLNMFYEYENVLNIYYMICEYPFFVSFFKLHCVKMQQNSMFLDHLGKKMCLKRYGESFGS